MPEDWEVRKLGEVAEIKRGKFTPRPRNDPKYYGGDIPFIQTGDITNSNGKIKRYTQTLNEKGLEVSVLFKKGTIFMTIAANIGYTAIIQIDMACTDSLVAINGCKKADNGFLNYYFIYKRQELENLSTSGAQKNLNIERLKPFLLPLPPLPEQTAIATALSDTDALLHSLETLLIKKRNIKQAAMQQLLAPQESWVVRRLGDVGSFSKGQGIRKDESNSGQIPCIRYGELYTKHNDYIKKCYSYISSDVAKGSKKLKCGDILFAGSGETKAEIGKCAAFIHVYEAYAGGDIVIFSPKDANSLFLGYLLNTPVIASQKASRGQGDAVVHISSNQLKNIEVYLPSLSEQIRISTILTDLDRDIEALEQKIAKYKCIKTGMMQNLLTGKIRLI